MTSRRSPRVTRFSRRFRRVVTILLCAALLLAPLPAVPATNASGPMQIKAPLNNYPAFVLGTWLAAVRARFSFQASPPNLDTMRAGTPQPPSYSPNSTLPPAGYDDPKPQLTANYNSYFTQLVQPHAVSGPAGALPLQLADPTAGSTSIGGVTSNLETGNFNFTAPALALAGRAGLALSLALSYSSNVWLKDTNTGRMVFNADRGFPAPGWRLAFGAIQVSNQWGN